MFEVYAGVDNHGETVSQHRCVLTVEYDTTVDHIEEQQEILGPVE